MSPNAPRLPSGLCVCYKLIPTLLSTCRVIPALDLGTLAELLHLPHLYKATS